MKPTNGVEAPPNRVSLSGCIIARALLVSCACLLMTACFSVAFAAELRAGLAKADITPQQPVRLAGYENRKDL